MGQRPRIFHSHYSGIWHKNTHENNVNMQEVQHFLMIKKAEERASRTSNEATCDKEMLNEKETYIGKGNRKG